MLKNNKLARNHIDLIRLKAAKILQQQDINIVLEDDIWDKDTLILKSGGYLTENLINKLINFGIKKVSVNFSQKTKEQRDTGLYQNFVKNQSVLVIENNLPNISWLTKSLIHSGLQRSNIFITDDYNSINKYFKNKKINFIFLSASFYEKCQKCIDKYSLLRNMHVFVLMEENDSARKLKNGYSSDIKFIIKPISTKKLKFFTNRALNQNFLDFCTEDTQIS